MTLPPPGYRPPFHPLPSAHASVVWPALPGPRAAVTASLLQQLEQSQWWSPEELRAQQLRQAGALLDHAYRHVPFYRERLAQAGHLPGKAPMVLFSLLKPRAHIPPHNGLINTRLICHLPLLVPGPAWLRVGSETRHWQEGKLLIFDDSIEHEAMNEADETRVVLLFDIWRPELTLQERDEVARLFGALSAYGDES